MADREFPYTRTRGRALATALLPAPRGGRSGEAVKHKIVGRLLLDGGTVEEPGRGMRALDLPRSGRRTRLRWRALE